MGYRLDYVSFGTILVKKHFVFKEFPNYITYLINSQFLL